MDRKAHFAPREECELPRAPASSVASMLLVDEVWLFREGLAELLRHCRWVGEVRTAADAQEAVATLNSYAPDVVLVSMSSSGGLANLAAVRMAAPEARVVALAVAETEDEIIPCAEAAVAGFLPPSS